MINTSGKIVGGQLKGVTANRNITAFSIAIKIPIMLYLIHGNKKAGLGNSICINYIPHCSVYQ